MRPTPLIHFLSCKLNFFQHFHFCISLVCEAISHYTTTGCLIWMEWIPDILIIKIIIFPLSLRWHIKNMATVLAAYNPPYPYGTPFTTTTTGWYLIFRAWQGAAVLQSSSEGDPSPRSYREKLGRILYRQKRLIELNESLKCSR